MAACADTMLLQVQPTCCDVPDVVTARPAPGSTAGRGSLPHPTDAAPAARSHAHKQHASGASRRFAASLRPDLAGWQRGTERRPTCLAAAALPQCPAGLLFCTQTGRDRYQHVKGSPPRQNDQKKVWLWRLDQRCPGSNGILIADRRDSIWHKQRHMWGYKLRMHRNTRGVEGYK